jgi:hypothetical protein
MYILTNLIGAQDLMQHQKQNDKRQKAMSHYTICFQHTVSIKKSHMNEKYK